VTVAGPGFLNVRLKDGDMWRIVSSYTDGYVESEMDEYKGKKYVIEYSCPNWFKELHTGHLYQTIVGDALARLVEKTGATVHRTTFGGDVGMHVARAMWSILSDQGGFDEQKQSGTAQTRAEFITKHYVQGSTAYESDESAKLPITELNKKIYQLNKDKDSNPDIAEQYFTCRDWSTDYFHHFYSLVQVDDFDKYYRESDTEQLGISTVKTGLEQGIFEKSDSAVIFDGEKRGLHKRVFLTSEGLPTYEAKDLGVILTEKDDFDFDYRILMTGSDQKAYMQVVWAALDELDPRFKGKMTHIPHGIIKFADGSKMSSRLGNVARAVDVIDAVSEAIGDSTNPEQKEKVVLGAIKYEFLKYHVGSDVAFDINESVSTKGNSGPYLQYAYVRAKKILDLRTEQAGVIDGVDLDKYERRLARKLAQYRSVIAESVKDLAPNMMCLYLYELAQVFNQFYENDQVAGSGREVRWELVSYYVDVLGDGLAVLGIETPQSM